MSIDCPDSLLARSRLGPLSIGEQRQLDAHLSRCADCRIALEVGHAFDAVLLDRASDDLITSRIAAGMSKAGPVRKARGRWRSLLVAAAILLTASAVVAAGSKLLPLWSTPPTSTEALVTPVGTTSGDKVTQEASVEAPITVEPVTVEQVAVEPPVAVEPAVVDPEHPKRRRVHNNRRDPDELAVTRPEPAPVPTAHALFADANALRRAGDAAGARAAYVELQRRYPTSREALTSHVTLGRLLLERLGDPAAALEQFDRYLAHATNAPLDEEALYGRASALLQLRRDAEERRTWEELLSRFPTSIYADRAMQRVGPRR
jgi:TolA-binding protein